MPISGPDPARGRLLGLRSTTAGTLAVLVLAACSGPTPIQPPAPDGAAARPGASPTGAPVPADLMAELTSVLERRADAVRRGDRRAFTAGLARWPDGFVAQQMTYLDNLGRLPLGELSYAVDRGSLVREGDDYWVAVDVVVQLAGYDAVPVTTRDRYRFSPSRRDPGRLLLSSVDDPVWEERTDVHPQPWDLGPIQVAEGAGVLLVVDDATPEQVGGLLASVERGVAEVAARVPYDWDRTVVVYALRDRTFLDSLGGLPGGSTSEADGVAFGVDAGPGSDEVASTRVVLNPTLLDTPGPERDRLVRHELTHVALGDLDDRAPVWLSEGLAEWVSVQPLAPEDRRTTQAALDAAEAGVEALPADEDFNGDASSANYGLAWWVCEYVAATYGEPMLWTLLDYVTVPGADPATRTRMALGITTRRLARSGAELLVRTFAPSAPGATPAPTPGPTPASTPGATPSG